MTGPGDAPLSFRFEGNKIPIHGEEPIAAALMRSGILITRRTRKGEPRGVFCGIGVCNDCLVQVNGRPNVRSCVVRAEHDLEVQLG